MFLQLAIECVQRAGEIQREYFEKSFKVRKKNGNELDLVTEVDTLCEREIISLIKAACPDHSVLAEESGTEKSSSGYKWIIDPIDGTTNYSHGFPFFCASVGLEYDGEVLAGAVYNPMLDELFTAEKGKGAYLDKAPIKPSSVDKLGESLLCTGFPYDIRTSDENNLDHFRSFAVRAQAVRRSGTAALELCYVAAGRFDGFWELKLKPWDTAAASLIVKEAGGVVTDFADAPHSIYRGEVLASNGKIHGEMLKLLNGDSSSSSAALAG